MALAKYDYIAFVDSDDYVSSEMFLHLINEITENAAELVVCSSYHVAQSCRVEPDDALDYQLLDKPLIIEKAIKPSLGFSSEKDLVNPCVWGKLFKKNLILENGIIFKIGRHYGEDWEFVIQYLNCCSLVLIIPERLYYYNVGAPDSKNLSRRYMPERFDVGINERKTFRNFAPYLDWNSDEKILDFLSTPRWSLVYYRMHCNAVVAFKWLRYMLSEIKKNDEYCELAKKYQHASKELYWFGKSDFMYEIVIYSMTTPRILKNKIKNLIHQ